MSSQTWGNSPIDSGLSSIEKKIANLQKKRQELLSWAWEVELAYIQKDPGDRDQYDIAFGSLNPDSKKKATQFSNLQRQIIELENEKVNLDSAREFMNEVYANQIGTIRQWANSLMNANAVNAEINRWINAWAGGAFGANPASVAASNAVIDNQLFQQQLQTMANRDNSLAQARANQANVPVALAQIWTANNTIAAEQAGRDADIALKQAQANYYNRPSGGGWSSGGNTSIKDILKELAGGGAEDTSTVKIGDDTYYTQEVDWEMQYFKQDKDGKITTLKKEEFVELTKPGTGDTLSLDDL